MPFTVEGESQPDPGRGDTPPSTPVQLHPTRENVRGAGWGRRQVNGAGSDSLQEVELRLTDPQACRHYLAFDHNPQLCVGNPRKTKTAFKVTLRHGFFSTNLCLGSRMSPGRRWSGKTVRQQQGFRS